MAQLDVVATKPANALEGALQAFVAGFVDNCGFIALFGLFTAHVTGNLALIGAAIVDHHGGLIAKLMALPVFVLAVAVCRWVLVRLELRGQNQASFLFVCEIVFLAGFLAAGVAISPIHDGDAPQVVTTGMLGVIAMAIQNTASRTVFAGHAPTTVMTGNVTEVVIDLVDLAIGRGTDEVRARINRVLPVLGAFAAGALVSALLYTHAGFWCLVVPIGVLGGLFVREITRKPCALAAAR